MAGELFEWIDTRHDRFVNALQHILAHPTRKTFLRSCECLGVVGDDIVCNQYISLCHPESTCWLQHWQIGNFWCVVNLGLFHRLFVSIICCILCALPCQHSFLGEKHDQVHQPSVVRLEVCLFQACRFVVCQLGISS